MKQYIIYEDVRNILCQLLSTHKHLGMSYLEIKGLLGRLDEEHKCKCISKKKNSSE